MSRNINEEETVGGSIVKNLNLTRCPFLHRPRSSGGGFFVQWTAGWSAASVSPRSGSGVVCESDRFSTGTGTLVSFSPSSCADQSSF